MTRTLFLAACALALVFSAGAAQAQTVACHDWSCDESTGDCSFDAGCSSASPFIWKYKFDWGDGTSTGLTGSPTHQHDYSSHPNCFADVTLTVYPWGGDPVSVECEIYVKTCPFGPGLPPSFYSGRCSS